MLEAVDIQNADEHLSLVCPFAVFTGQALVNDSHKPFENASVNEFGHGISDTGCLCSIQIGDDPLVPGGDLFLDRPPFEFRQGDAEEASSHLESRISVIDNNVVTHRGDLDVSKVQESGEKFENGPLLLYTDPNGGKGVLGLPELFSVVDAINGSRGRTALLKVVELSNVGVETQVLSFFQWSAST